MTTLLFCMSVGRDTIELVANFEDHYSRDEVTAIVRQVVLAASQHEYDGGLSAKVARQVLEQHLQEIPGITCYPVHAIVNIETMPLELIEPEQIEQLEPAVKAVVSDIIRSQVQQN